jgi:diaminopropionate ammonia-lyase
VADRIVPNPAWRPGQATAPSDAAARFHRDFPGSAPTPLASLPGLARELGVAVVHVKDETHRFGTTSFKIMGAAWASHSAICERLSADPQRYDAAGLRDLCAAGPPLTLVAATAGNHGHAVARTARMLGVAAEILVPAATHPARVAAIRAEGADVRVVDGDYDETVRRAAAMVDGEHLLVADTSSSAADRSAAHVVDGYASILREVDADLAERGLGQPDVVFAPVGVGSFATAVVRHYMHAASPALGTRIVGVEPDVAACLAASIRAGRRTDVDAGSVSVMAGMNCGAVSVAAWPELREGVHSALSVSDADALRGAQTLRARGVDAGPCGGAGVGGALAHRDDPEARRVLGLRPDSALLFLVTEGTGPWNEPAAV